MAPGSCLGLTVRNLEQQNRGDKGSLARGAGCFTGPVALQCWGHRSAPQEARAELSNEVYGVSAACTARLSLHIPSNSCHGMEILTELETQKQMAFLPQVRDAQSCPISHQCGLFEKEIRGQMGILSLGNQGNMHPFSFQPRHGCEDRRVSASHL